MTNLSPSAPNARPVCVRALQRGPPAHSLRVRAIVSTSFNVAFESVVPLIAVSALGDPYAAVRVASLMTGIYALTVVLLRSRQILAMGAYRTRSIQIMMVLGPLSVVLFFVSALVPASIAIYALALCFQLGVAAFSFYSSSPRPPSSSGTSLGWSSHAHR